MSVYSIIGPEIPYHYGGLRQVLPTATASKLCQSNLPGNIVFVYRGEKTGLQILVSYSQEGPRKKVKQGMEEISHNHVQGLFLGSVSLDA